MINVVLSITAVESLAVLMLITATILLPSNIEISAVSKACAVLRSEVLAFTPCLVRGRVRRVSHGKGFRKARTTFSVVRHSLVAAGTRLGYIPVDISGGHASARCSHSHHKTLGSNDFRAEASRRWEFFQHVPSDLDSGLAQRRDTSQCGVATAGFLPGHNAHRLLFVALWGAAVYNLYVRATVGELCVDLGAEMRGGSWLVLL